SVPAPAPQGYVQGSVPAPAPQGYVQGSVPAPQFGSPPSSNAPLHDTERLGNAAPTPWQPPSSHPGLLRPTSGAAVDSANWGVARGGLLMTPPTPPSGAPGPFFGHPPAPSSSTAPLLKTPPADPASYTMVAMLSAANSRRRMTVLVVGAMAGIALFLL